MCIFATPCDPPPCRIEQIHAQDISSGRSLQTREIIQYIGDHLHEVISRGSYDDIRRKDLILLTAANVVVPSKPGAAKNDPERGYALSQDHADLVRQYGASGWVDMVQRFMEGRENLAETLAQQRVLDRIEVTLPDDQILSFGPGKHNDLIKLLIEEFLPKFGYGAEVLYVGDAENRMLHHEADRLRQLGFFELGSGELPDIVAHSPAKNWLYLIEAVHSSGAISPLRRRLLQGLCSSCTADLIFVTAFLDRKTFRQFTHDIAWETEVWLAEDPDHLIHFNGDKFLGPYISQDPKFVP